MKKLLPILLLLLATPLAAQTPWASLLDPSRAIDWTQNPARQFVIPSGSWTQCVTIPCNTVTSAGTSATAAQINAAIQGASANTYVLLASGTYNLSSCLAWAGHSFVVLRGGGASATRLKFTGSGCSGYSGGTMVQMQASVNTFDQAGQNAPGASNSLSITGTTEGGAGVYPQGATRLQVASVGTDTPHVGTMLFIDQADDTVVNNGWLQCQVASSPSPGTISSCSENGAGNGRLIAGVLHEQVQSVIITNINGSTYTISPGLYANNMRTSQGPGAWWNTSSALCTQCGIENLTIDTFGASFPTLTSAVNIYDCYQCWFQNTRVLNGGQRNDFYIVQSNTVIFRNNYFNTTQASSSGGGYIHDPVEVCDVLVENNIYEHIDNPVVAEQSCGFIFGYNYSRDTIFGNGVSLIDVLPSHDSGQFMNLYEGNIVTQVSHDTQHGPSPAITYFRNRIQGQQPLPLAKGQFLTPIELQSQNHGENFIGNVIGERLCSGGAFNGQPADMASQCTGGTLPSNSGATTQTNYQASPGTTGGNPGAGGSTTGCPLVIWMLGWPTGGCAGSAGNLLSDPVVAATLMRWGNYDVVNNAVQWNAAEATTTAGSFLPANFTSGYFGSLAHTLPVSLYYTTTPNWWGPVFGVTPPFPPIGPDVTSGDMGGVNGLANRNPARLCSDGLALDVANYPATTIKLFDAATCYTNNPAPSGPPASSGTIFAGNVVLKGTVELK